MGIDKKTVVSCALVMLVLSSGAIAQPGTSAEAVKILEKVKQLEGTSFRTKYSADMQIEQFGTKMNVKMNGELTQGGDKLQHNKVSMSMEGMPGMPGPLEMDMLSIIDGETIWIDMSHPMMGRQVMKIALDQADKLAPMGGGMTPGNNAGSNPVSQIHDLAKIFDFEIVGRDAGLVTLRAVLNEDATGKLGGSLPAVPAGTTITLVIEERSGKPRQMKLGDIMEMRFEDFALLDEADVDRGMFRFEKPEGVPVMDLGAMANQLSGAGAP